MRPRILLLMLCLLLTVGRIPAATAETAETAVPDALRPWQAWVLQPHKTLHCPFLYNGFDNKRCAWPSRLEVRVDGRQARFSQQWTLYAPGWVSLPGSIGLWPLDVTTDGGPLSVIERNGAPAVLLEPGSHQIQGRLQWQKPPQYLSIPPDTGLLALHIEGRAIHSPAFESGRLWLAERERGVTAEAVDTLNVQVYRKVVDSLPMTVETELRLTVAGNEREVQLGRLLLADSTPLWLQSPLPARIETDGRLRIQLRPGHWVVRLGARYNRPLSTLRMAALDDHWPPQEIWAFQPQRHLRGVEVRGPRLIDPRQVDAPTAWQALPTYLMTPQVGFNLHELYRGDASPPPNELTLKRQFWLDFDGAGFTVKDQMSGVLHRPGRFAMQPDYALGRVSLNGAPQLITALADQVPGIEVPAGTLSLDALSRIPRQGSPPDGLPVTGWQQDIRHASGVLQLPPGWRLLHASGVDQVNHSWLSRWTLWDLFLCLVIAGAMVRITRLAWGVLAGVTLALSYHEPFAPVGLWLNLLLVIGLLKVIPNGKVKKLLGVYQVLSVLALLLVALNFSVEQIRKGIYPQLERSQAIHRVERYESRSREVAEGLSRKAAEAEPEAPSSADQAAPLQSEPERRTDYDPGAQIQTGPGEPSWQWHPVGLTWSGPVAQTQRMQLYLLDPTLTRLGRFATVALLLLWLFGLIRHAGWAPPRPAPQGGTAGVLLAIALGIILGGPAPRAEAAFPSPELLEQLEQRLTRPPDCVPGCAAIQRVDVQVADRQLRIRLAVDAEARIELPLPHGRNTWSTDAVVLDRQPAPNLSRDRQGQLAIMLPEGNHQIMLIGTLAADASTLQFPVTPRNVTITAPDWQVSGLVEGNVPGGSIQLARKVTAAAAISHKRLLPDPAPPFVTVLRTLHLGLDWQLVTEVRRVAPRSGAINLALPLLANESVLSENLRVEDGHAIITMSPEQPHLHWRSSLPLADAITLTAPEVSHWVEHWRLAAAPIWHIRASGINPIRQDANATRLMPEWHPWPGEHLALEVLRPHAVAGATQTVEHVALVHRPGTRISQSTLTLQIRASHGGEYALTLPEGARIQTVEIDGRPQILAGDESPLQLPLHPGLQDIRISWQAPQTGSLLLQTPALGLSTPASNIDLSLHLPRSRWPLLLGGPAIGPAMLYWSVLIMILLVAGALGWSVRHFRLDMPIRTYQWVLLGLGVSTVTAVGGVLIVLWFLAFERRPRLSPLLPRWQYNLIQLGLIALSVAALGNLIATIPFSLLATPDMKVAGNFSGYFFYRWYQDSVNDAIPQGWVVSLPIWVYRLAMLAWSLWLVFTLLGWLRWGWQRFSHGEIWKKKSQLATAAGTPERSAWGDTPDKKG